MSDRIFQILVVDDSDADVRLIKEMLREWTVLHCINVAQNAMEAIDVLCQQGNYHGAPRPDLILLDINMPGMSGLELLPKAKAARPDVPVIMITAYGDAETKRKALEGGADALFTKPIDFAALRGEIETRVERSA